MTSWGTICTIALAFLPAAAPAAAQGLLSSDDGFHLSGTQRLRAEAIIGQPRAGVDGDDLLLNLRTTLLAHYRRGSVTLAAELWDSRAWGAADGTPLSTNEVNALEPVQAFIRIEAADAPGFTLDAGRFMLNIGSRRLIAADDYRNTTNGYTGVKLDLGTRGGSRLSALYVLPQQRLPDDMKGLRSNRAVLDREGFDLQLYGALGSYRRLPAGLIGEAGLFRLVERDRDGRATRDRELTTASIRLLRPPAIGRIDFEIEAIGQRGSIAESLRPGAPRLDVAAWFLHADIGYSFPGGWKPRIAIDYDHASGDRPGGRYTRFDTLFGMRRAELGPAGLYNAFGRTNVLSPGLRLEATPGHGTDLMATLRPMWLDAATDGFSTTGVRDPSGRSGRHAGTQLDFRLRHEPTPRLQLELTAVGLLKGRFLTQAPNANPDRRDTLYVSLNASTGF